MNIKSENESKFEIIEEIDEEAAIKEIEIIENSDNSHMSV